MVATKVTIVEGTSTLTEIADEVVNVEITGLGIPGQDGVGVPSGGTTGQVLSKVSSDDFDTTWVDAQGAVWGAITGTLSDQTDLQSALDGKAATSHTHVEADITDLGNYIEAGDNISLLTNDSGYITDYTVTEGDVTQHESAITITENQISDLKSYVEEANKATQVQAEAGTDNATWMTPLRTAQAIDELADAAEWGQITGTLSNQTDLQSALDDKADISHTHIASDVTDFDTEVSNNTDVSANTIHRGLTDNPHSVTKAQIGLSNVTNDLQVRDADKATQAEAEAGTDDTKWMTPLKTKQAIDEFAGSSGEANTASNLGAGEGVFGNKTGVDLRFKSLIEGSNVTLSSTADEITIAATDTDTTYTAGTGITLVGTEFSTDDGAINHNALLNYVAAEHVDWAVSQATDIHPDNYTDTDTTYTAGTGLDLTGTEFSTNDSQINHNNLQNTHNLTTDIDHNQLTNYNVTEHRIINDAGTSLTELWSASKISSELDGKADTSHTHVEADITDLGDYSEVGHTHTLSDVTDSGALAALSTVDTAQIDDEAVTEAKLDVLNAPTDEHVLSWNDSSGRFEWVEQAAGGGTPGGDDTQIQFNDGGSFGGSPNLVWDDSSSTDILKVNGSAEVFNNFRVGATSGSLGGIVFRPTSLSTNPLLEIDFQSSHYITLSNSGVGLQTTLAMNSNKITSVADPTSAQDAATKAYVDANAGGDPSVLTRTTVENDYTIQGSDQYIAITGFPGGS